MPSKYHHHVNLFNLAQGTVPSDTIWLISYNGIQESELKASLNKCQDDPHHLPQSNVSITNRTSFTAEATKGWQPASRQRAGATSCCRWVQVDEGREAVGLRAEGMAPNVIAAHGAGPSTTCFILG